MLFSTSTNYALRAVLFLALESSKQRKVGIRELANQLNMPYHFLGKLLQTLARNNLVQSAKGPNGGFYLTEEEKTARIMAIVEIFEGPDLFRKCALGLSECSDKYPCPLHFAFKDYRENMKALLKRETIKDWSEGIGEGKSVLR